tara:strand:+ start:170 stop:505 length:336 start_codon:yes stop_codon:yes gene_type:complete
MIKKTIILIALGVTLSGCFMAPIAFVGPATSGFTTSSILQSGMTSGANYLVKKSTGKTIAEHAFQSVSKDYLKQTYMPNEYVKSYSQKKNKDILRKKRVSKKIVNQSFLSN